MLFTIQDKPLKVNPKFEKRDVLAIKRELERVCLHFLVPFDGGRCCVVCFLFEMSYLFWGVEIHEKRKNKYKKGPETIAVSGPFSGGDNRDRTDDLLNAIQALSQLSYTPESFSFGTSVSIAGEFLFVNDYFSLF